jgi:hypothetical protein
MAKTKKLNLSNLPMKERRAALRDLAETAAGEGDPGPGQTIWAQARQEGNIFIVDYCPYCRGCHVHGAAGLGHRQADCGRGGYMLLVV